ncbi:hypothetical protein TNCV_2110151 [Trichonephila clavipes]|nr:hypothetical protein TNCV_2110151 [Trichonephila clavipes]
MTRLATIRYLDHLATAATLRTEMENTQDVYRDSKWRNSSPRRPIVNYQDKTRNENRKGELLINQIKPATLVLGIRRWIST